MNLVVLALLSRAVLPAAPELVCAAQREVAARWRGERSWSDGLCRRVAAEASRDREPRVVLAVLVLESDLVSGAVAWVRRGGVNCRRTDCSDRELREGDVADVGLGGVRCVLGADLRCSVGPAKGLTVARLRDPVANVRAARRLLDLKRASAGHLYLARYHGSRSDRDPYATYVWTLVAAMDGWETRSKKRRVAAHASAIAAWARDLAGGQR